MRARVASWSRRVRSSPETSAANAGWAGAMVRAAAMVAMETSSREILALHRPGDQSLHHPAVDQHVEDDHRDRGDHRGRHELTPTDHAAHDDQPEAATHRQAPPGPAELP